MSSPIGSALGAFASNSVAPIVYDKTSKKNLKFLGEQFQGDSNALQAYQDQFAKANQGVINAYNTLRPQLQQGYQDLYSRSLQADPLADYERLRSGNLAALKDYSGYLEGRGSRADSLALAAMGMGGRPDSSYSTALRADRISRNISPALGQIMASLGSDTSTIGNQRAQNLNNSSVLLSELGQAPMVGYGLELAPSNSLLAMRNGQLGVLGNTVDVAKNNTAGWQQKSDSLGKVANSMNAFNDSMWSNIGNALSVYSSLYGGGMLGGMGGGGGGGIKTGSTPAGSNSFSIGAGSFGSGSPYAGNYAPTYGGGGGGQSQYPWSNYSSIG